MNMLQSIGDNLKDNKIGRLVIENSPMGKIYVDTYHYLNRYFTIAHQQRRDCYPVVSGYYGYAICNPEDEFNRKTGESLALGRLLTQSISRFSFTTEQMNDRQIDQLYRQHLDAHLRQFQEGIDEIAREDIFRDAVISWANHSNRKKTNHIVKNHLPPM